jgi:two-component system, NarL family, response regulator NreC
VTINVTPRQRQILELAASGHSDKQIASLLGISVPTVRSHFGRLFRVNGLHNRTEAVSKWLLSGDDRSEI